MGLPDLPPPRNIGISISESPDMRYFGFTDGHLKDATGNARTAQDLAACQRNPR